MIEVNFEYVTKKYTVVSRHLVKISLGTDCTILLNISTSLSYISIRVTLLSYVIVFLRISWCDAASLNDCNSYFYWNVVSTKYSENCFYRISTFSIIYIIVNWNTWIENAWSAFLTNSAYIYCAASSVYFDVYMQMFTVLARINYIRIYKQVTLTKTYFIY